MDIDRSFIFLIHYYPVSTNTCSTREEYQPWEKALNGFVTSAKLDLSKLISSSYVPLVAIRVV